MKPIDFLLRGILTGLLFGLLIGALTVRLTFRYGIRAGFLTGLGSAADCFYACVGVFGFTLISDFLLSYQKVINILGGSLILVMGVRLLLCQAESMEEKSEAMGAVKRFLSSFAVGITNPAAILPFLFAFTYFGISTDAGILQGVSLVCGAFIGTYIWWGGTLSVTARFIRKKTSGFSFLRMNRFFGTILCLFGMAVFLRLSLS